MPCHDAFALLPPPPPVAVRRLIFTACCLPRIRRYYYLPPPNHAHHTIMAFHTPCCLLCRDAAVFAALPLLRAARARCDATYAAAAFYYMSTPAPRHYRCRRHAATPTFSSFYYFRSFSSHMMPRRYRARRNIFLFFFIDATRDIFTLLPYMN